jgi:phosphodiester glycosidase
VGCRSLGFPAIAWLCAHALCAQARADESWSDPYPGIRHLHATLDGPIEAHAIVVDLAEPGIAVRASTRRERWQTVSELGARAGCAVAVNGGFWTVLGQGPAGVAAAGGRPWIGAADDGEYGFFALTRHGRPWISPPADVVNLLPGGRIAEAVSGRPLLLERGRPAAELADFPFRRNRHPRTAVGVSRDGRFLFLVAVDGRQPRSKGMNVAELSRFLAGLGAWSALNLDGGGSTSLFVAAEGGLVDAPCRGERTVLNHLCVLQPRGPTPKPGGPTPPPPTRAARALPRVPPRIRPVLVRELWAPTVAAGVLAVVAAQAARRGRRAG